MNTLTLDEARRRFPDCIVDWDIQSDVFTIVWSGWNNVPYERRIEDVQALLANVGQLARFKHVFALTPAELAIFNSL